MTFPSASVGSGGMTVLNPVTATYDPPNMVSGDQSTTTVAVAGAEMGDFAMASFSISLAGVTLSAFVSSPGVVTVVFFNGTAGDVNLGSGTVKVRVIK